MEPIKVLLADDHPLFRSGLTRMLQREHGFEVTGETSRGDEAVKLAMELEPDLIIMDVSMPGLDGLEATKRIKARQPGIQILILSMYSDDAYWREAMDAGASGYVLKRAVDTELMIAIRNVMDGEHYVYPTLLGGFCKAKQETPETSPEEDSLSPREREVLLYLALGHTQQEIADLLRVSIKTVDSYKTRLMEKLGFAKRSELVRYALKHNIISDKNV
jgi:two-component system, NarL family, response regulator NreC